MFMFLVMFNVLCPGIQTLIREGDFVMKPLYINFTDYRSTLHDQMSDYTVKHSQPSFRHIALRHWGSGLCIYLYLYLSIYQSIYIYIYILLCNVKPM